MLWGENDEIALSTYAFGTNNGSCLVCKYLVRNRNKDYIPVLLVCVKIIREYNWKLVHIRFIWIGSKSAATAAATHVTNLLIFFFGPCTFDEFWIQDLEPAVLTLMFRVSLQSRFT